MPYPIVQCQTAGCEHQATRRRGGIYRCRDCHVRHLAAAETDTAQAALEEARLFYGGDAVKEHHNA